MPYRYRDKSGGSTHRCLKAVKRNLMKLGAVTEIRGYRFTSTRKPRDCSEYTTQHEALILKGPNGTQRYEGVLWGYGGDGPRGLSQILQACGFNKNVADKIAFNTFRNDKNGTDFSIKFPVAVPVDPTVINANA